MLGARCAAFTAIEKAGIAAVSLPSLTAMAMSMYSPAAAAPGVPLSRPLAALNEAQGGLLAMLNVSVCPSGSDAVGVNEYAVPASTSGDGVPLIDGARLVAGFEQPVANLPLPRQSRGSAEASRAPAPTARIRAIAGTAAAAISRMNLDAAMSTTLRAGVCRRGGRGQGSARPASSRA